MKTHKISFYSALSLVYLVPLCVIAKVAALSLLLLSGLALWSMLGLSILIYFVRFIERKMKREVSAEVSTRICQIEKKTLAHLQNQTPSVDLKKVRILARELEEQSRRERALIAEIDQLKNLHTDQESDYAHLNADLQNQLDKKETILSEYRTTLKEQRKIIEKKQEEVNILQLRVNDLKYEVDGLLKFKEKEPGKKGLFLGIKKEEPNQAILEEEDEPLEKRSGLLDSVQVKLDRYVKMAAKLNGASHFTNKNFKYSDLSLGSLIIDQRRLFDRLQNEEHETILVYSREENRLVFINQQVKELFGWSPERFLKDFSFLLQKGHSQWNEALEDVKLDLQKNIRLLIKTRSGKDILIHCYLKEVPEGIFKGYVLGILSAATALS